jgi:hypothetical protein
MSDWCLNKLDSQLGKDDIASKYYIRWDERDIRA